MDCHVNVTIDTQAHNTAIRARVLPPGNGSMRGFISLWIGDGATVFMNSKIALQIAAALVSAAAEYDNNQHWTSAPAAEPSTNQEVTP